MFRKYKQDLFPTACGYLKELGEFAIEHGYTETRLGRKRFFNVPRWCPSYDAKQLYKDYRYNPEKEFSDEDMVVIEKVKKHQEMTAAIQREGANHVIQGGNADITKTAMVEIRRRIKAGGYHANICNQVYDEIILECDDGDVDAVAKIQEECMLAAEQKFFTKVPAEIEQEVSQVWTKG